MVLIRAATKKRVAEILGVTPASLTQNGIHEQEYMAKFAVKPETPYYHIGRNDRGFYSDGWVELGAGEERPLTLDSNDVTIDVLNLHYPSFDTEGREESDLPARIASSGDTYDLKWVSMADLPETSEYDVEEDKVEEFAEKTTPVPPIVIGEGGEIIDGGHRMLAARKRGDAGMLAYVARPR